MISFRFQVVALATVTLALTAGLVVGNLADRSAAAGPARQQAGALDQRSQQLRTQVDQLGRAVVEQAAGTSALVDRLAPAVLGGRLAGTPVLLLYTADAASEVLGVARMLQLAGAGQTGRLRLTDAFTDPSHRDELLDLATAALPPSVTSGLPVTSDGVVATSALLADVLLPHSPAVGADDLRSVLAAYISQGYLVADQPVTGPAAAVIMLTGPAPTTADAAGRTDALLILAGELAQAGQLVVGSDGADQSLTGRIRADSTLGPRLSTVDNIGTVQGQLVCVWALTDQLGGQVGRYGSGPGATAVPALPSTPMDGSSPDPNAEPSPIPTPTPTPTPAPTPTTVG